MAAEPFQFKQFSVAQDLCTHKVGTDGVLLGAWVRVFRDDRHVLDVGTGSGLIALMLAQRSCGHAAVDAIDIEESDVIQAEGNVLRSPWKEKITVRHTALQHFFPEKKYDLIVANPPFFTAGVLPPAKRRSQARHTHSLPPADLLKHATRLLKTSARLGVILPFLEALTFIDLARSFGLALLRKTSVRSRPYKPVERILVELGFDGQPEAENELTIHHEGNRWSQEYIDLTRDFYLKL
ncbi:MAG TPA: methyltransferase [Chryseosolibacter sp.]